MFFPLRALDPDLGAQAPPRKATSPRSRRELTSQEVIECRLYCYQFMIHMLIIDESADDVIGSFFP
ncbi:MAG: hypothetical protein QF515_18180 [Pseudomonadales bacterium]|jgi:hypothetical protein|nr:hypothetical protein [Pseudomonadales bacterium]MDP6829023.1 hypothetical protein [Pseudomonadales bacterium]|tara:strand:- start:4374 stop:4571 length:198 start_codon:yes stop_codon:yes gene_type:complete